MTITHRSVRAGWLVIIATLLASSAAFAQSQVRVVKDGATIWRLDAPSLIATTVKAGTLLDVVARESGWYVVTIPPENGGNGETGRIAVSQVETIGGGVQRPPNPPGVSTPARRAAAPPRRIEVLGFGDFAYGAWLAHETFDAVLGSAGAPMFGGGAQVSFRRLFIEGAVEWFEKTGSRVFVNDGRVFNLGVADTVRVIPIAATVGYRHRGRRATPYVGGGIGTYLYKETSDFADPSENLDQHFASYHVLAGVESGDRRRVRVAFEVQFTTVPKALGDSGASAAFHEQNLGGVQARLKILAGRN